MTTLTNLFQKVRLNYLEELHGEIERYNRCYQDTDIEALVEQAGGKKLPSAYQLHRVDMVSNAHDYTNFSEFQTRNAIYFKPRDIQLSKNTQLRLEPFLWQEVDIECVGADLTSASLQSWLYKWITENGKRHACPFRLKGCIHGVNMPPIETQKTRFSVDMGSANEQGLVELIHTLIRLRAQQIRIYSRSLYM